MRERERYETKKKKDIQSTREGRREKEWERVKSSERGGYERKEGRKDIQCKRERKEERKSERGLN